MIRVSHRSVHVVGLVVALAGAACSSPSSDTPAGGTGGSKTGGRGGSSAGAGGNVSGGGSSGKSGSGGSDAGGGSGGSGGDNADAGDAGSNGNAGSDGGGGSSDDGGASSPDADSTGTGGTGGNSATGYLFGAHPLKYPAGSIRPTGDQATLDAAVAAAYDKWKSYVSTACGGLVVATKHGETGEVTGSEALGRGMIFAAMMAGHDPDAQKLFDGLYTVGRAKHSVYKGNEALVSYSVPANCMTTADDGSIFSGDADFAYGLLLADKQWGSTGTIKYADEAKATIASMKKFDMNPTLHIPLDGDWAALPGEDMKGWFTDTQPGNFTLGHFRVFAKAAADPFWMDTVTTLQGIIDTMQSMYSPPGYLPEFLDEGKPAKPNYGIAFNDKAHAGDFSGNAALAVLRLAADYAASGDAKTKAELTKLFGSIKMTTGGDPGKIVDGYTLAGMAFGTKGTPFFVAPLATASMFDGANQAWLDASWKLMLASAMNGVDSETDSTNLLGMLLVSGNWWSP